MQNLSLSPIDENPRLAVLRQLFHWANEYEAEHSKKRPVSQANLDSERPSKRSKVLTDEDSFIKIEGNHDVLDSIP